MTGGPLAHPVVVGADEAAVRELARTRGGVIGWTKALQAGFTWRSIGTRVERGSWQRVGRAIVILDLHSGGDRAAAWLLHLHAGARSIVSGPLAARLLGWGIPGADHIVVNPTPVRTPEGIRLHVLRRSHPRRVRRKGCPPLAPRMDALVDVLTCRPDPRARALIDLALQQRWIDVADLDRVIAERSGPGPRGQRRLVALRSRAASGSRSEAEQRMAHLLRRAAGGWIANYAVHDDVGRIVAEIDFADPERLIAIEVDGRAFHSDRGAFERDRARQNMLVVRGWTVLRFTWERIVNDPERVLAEVAASQRHIHPVDAHLPRDA